MQTASELDDILPGGDMGAQHCMNAMILHGQGTPILRALCCMRPLQLMRVPCRLAVCCLEETVAHYVASLLTYTRAITDPFLKRMEADYQQLCDFFEKSCAKERVRCVRDVCLCSVASM